MINSNHIELQRFLEDAGNLALERMQDAVERHGSVLYLSIYDSKNELRKSEHRVQWRIREG